MLNQNKYVYDLIAKVGIFDLSSFPTPMTGTSINRIGMDTCLELFHDVSLYLSTIGVLQHVCITRPDFHFAVNKVIQYMQSPYMSHWKAIVHILRFLKGTLSHGLLFRASPSPTREISLLSFFNVDWGSDIADRL